MNDDIDAQIHARIRSIKGRRRGDPQELHDHIVDAAQEMSDSAPGSHEVDAAFAALGSDAEIREAFFPRPPRIAVTPQVLFTLVAAAVVAALVTVLADGGGATCTVSGDGTCTASDVGLAADALLIGAAPLVTLACLRWLPAWTGILPAAVFVFLAVMRFTSTTDGALADAVVLVAALATLAIAARHTILERRLRT